MILDCGHAPSTHGEYTTGYGSDKDGRTYCYECCAKQDRQSMQETGRITLYLTHGKLVDYGFGMLTNWPGLLSYSCTVKKGRHNIAGTRYDVRFEDETGAQWHGVQYGENTQLCHCRRLAK
jgi:hypothetical protein